MHYLLWGAGMALLVIQYFISKQRIVMLGAILPTVYIIFLVWLFVERDASWKDSIILFIIGMALLLGEWIAGWEAYKKKQKRELEKMKGRDLT